MKVLFVGGGNMANALIGGLTRRGWSGADCTVVEIDEGARRRLFDAFGVRALERLPATLDDQAAVVLAVKPQQLRPVAQVLAPMIAGRPVISIAAGIRTSDLSRWLGGHVRTVRVMPNTPALVLAGVTGLYAMPGATGDDRDLAESILSAVGTTLWVEREELLDSVTAVSGSGPAYVFYFIEALAQAAEDLGLTHAQARLLATETFHGSAVLARQSEEEAGVLRARVTSKGGTTERALRTLDAEEVRRRVIEAVKQAAVRSRELGDELGRD
ncbi:MAG: pyrroline-5-carboxylate reductase [Burkholderiales bacterium]|nr:pyrroline-5-carboxylate reductase [Burkholderiales bacterium]